MDSSAFLSIINTYRQQNGLLPLQLSTTLTNAAQWMANDMATKNYFSHTDSLQRDPFARLDAFGYPSNSTEGENITAGYNTAQEAFVSWRDACDPDSSGKCTYEHRANMLNPAYKAIGIGRATNPNSTYKYYWVTDFGSVLTSSSSSSSSSSSRSTSSSTVQIWFISLLFIILFLVLIILIVWLLLR